MTLTRATVILATNSGIPSDASRNVWHFDHSGPTNDAVMTRIGQSLRDFYNTWSDQLSGELSRVTNACAVEFATVTPNLGGAKDDRVSKLTGTFRFTLISGSIVATNLPSEVAIALSFRGDITGLREEEPGPPITRPASRRRGRVYLGPWNTTVMADEATTDRTHVPQSFRDELRDSYRTMITAVNVAPELVRHVVYSRVNGLAYPVQDAHVDEAFDTVRRRGRKSKARSVVTVVQPVA